MYITSIVFTLIAWGAGLLLDANIHFGDPQGFLCLRVLLPVLAKLAQFIFPDTANFAHLLNGL